eukprot:6482274-Amphidinium_carterae.1
MIGNRHFHARTQNPLVSADLVFHPHRMLTIDYCVGDLRYPQLPMAPPLQAAQTKFRTREVDWGELQYTGDLDRDYHDWASMAMGELIGAGEETVLRKRQSAPQIVDKSVSAATAEFIQHRRNSRKRTAEMEVQHRLHELLLAIDRGLIQKQRAHLLALQSPMLSSFVHLDMAELSEALLREELHLHKAELTTALGTAEEQVRIAMKDVKDADKQGWLEWKGRHLMHATPAAFKVIKNK